MTLIAMAGLPGAGKSTMAEALARELPAAILSVDPVERERGIPELPEPTWGAVLARRAELDAWDGPRLVLDSMAPLGLNVARAKEYISG